MYAYIEDLSGSCGIGHIFEYDSISSWNNYPLNKLPRVGGTGMTIASFINNVNCKKAYDILTTSYPVLYQSPVRRNNNTGRLFFFIIICTRRK